ncbi:dehydrogenase large subunit protein [Novosphingobium sp. Rr 2-17]|uniref:GMC family oxidoreductase n=1 Tax=Novosphingobium sp. Rr 2-17 TaxID=555793 RepID=UPI000269A872|nr:GMC family oxidoreductase [Novosphingobium sp. Rr 2-17]EIZ77910.1 dehydrogenase large subunit protein [Novosphingobium sp. Rr 2-17]
MSLSHHATHDHASMPLAPTIQAKEAVQQEYDAVIVGAGISGAILAQELTRAGKRVLLLEAGLGRDLSQDGYEKYLETFYANPVKDNQAPFPRNPNAEMPRSPDLRKLAQGQVNSEAYWVQSGPYVSDSVHTRVLGGTTVHWEAKAIRMLREDFQLKSRFGQGLDWPADVQFEHLMPYYDRAEKLMGVSGDAQAQRRLGVEYSADDYVYPMVELKASYLDQIVAKGTQGMRETVAGEEVPIEWTTFPQAKNADPNPAYAKWNDGRPYRPMGAVSLHQNRDGERCQGNTNCVPLCPVQARFDARKILVKSLWSGRAGLLTQAVASRLIVDPVDGTVTGVEVKHYHDRASPAHDTITVRGKLVILAASAVENARLMRASAVLNEMPVNDLVGRHLMDHPYLLCWGLLPQDAGVGRGPSCTSGLCNFRKGAFRRSFASFAADIHNDGWGWATGAPVSDLTTLVDQSNLHGRALRDALQQSVARQLLLAYMIEMPADPESRVTVDPAYVDRLGNMRPVVRFKLSPYSLDAAHYARGLSSRIFSQLGAQDHTAYDTGDYGYVLHKGEGFAIRGGNHLSGTHVMGTNKGNSVVDSDQKSHDHPNLYLIGPGSMPSIGSSNTTLTAAALCLKTSEAALRHLASL